MNDTTICDRCGCDLDLAEANYAGPELPLWEGATLCNDCYAAERPPTRGPVTLTCVEGAPTANARLIAQAPALLAELRRAQAWVAKVAADYDGDGSGLGGRASKQLDRMVAVIAAATGEED